MATQQLLKWAAHIAKSQAILHGHGGSSEATKTCCSRRHPLDGALSPLSFTHESGYLGMKQLLTSACRLMRLCGTISLRCAIMRLRSLAARAGGYFLIDLMICDGEN